MKTIWIIVSFLLLSLQPLLAAETDFEKINIPSIKYQSQKLLYLFLIKDYPSLLEFASDSANTQDERDFAQFLLQLPALSESKKNSSPGKFQLDDSALLKLQVIAYGNRKYEEALTLSRMSSSSGDTLYREGMSLLGMGKLEDAGRSLEQVLPDDPLFPYARIALIQKEVMRQNIDGAEKDVRYLISHPSVSKSSLSDKVRLLLGQILFEKGLYSEALQEFIGIPQNSPFYEDALLGQAWCYAKLEDYVKAISLFEKTKMDILDPSSREALITLGHSLIRSGSLAQAGQHFDQALAVGVSYEKELSQLVDNKWQRGKYISLLKGDVEPVTEQEQRYLSYLNRKPSLESLLSEIRYLETIKGGFLKIKHTIRDSETRFDNIGNGLNEMAGRIESEIADLKDTLLKADISLDPDMVKMANKRKKINDQAPVNNNISNMLSAWKYSVEREIRSETQIVAGEILKELARDKELRCFDEPVICHIASYLAYNKGSFDKSQIRRIVLLLDSMIGDMLKARNGKNIYFEELLPGVRGNISNKTATINKTIDTIKKLKEATDFNINEVEKVLKTAHGILDLYILQSFINARYDMEDFKSKVVAGINSIENSSTDDSRVQTSK